MTRFYSLVGLVAALAFTLQASAEPLPLTGCQWGPPAENVYGKTIGLHKSGTSDAGKGIESWSSHMKGQKDFYVDYDTNKHSLKVGQMLKGNTHAHWMFTFYLKGPQPGAQWGSGPDDLWNVYLYLDPSNRYRECTVPQFVQHFSSMTVSKVRM